MEPIWLIERGVYGETAESVCAEVRRQGMICYLVDYQPGKSPPHDIQGAEAIADGARVVLWGTLPLMRQIQLHRRWRPGGWCHVENLACSTYYRHFELYLLNSKYAILPGIEAARREAELFDEFGAEDEIFVRPDSMEKRFPGMVVHRENFRDLLSASRYDPTIQVVIASPQEVEREWRLVVAGNEIVAACQYRDAGALCVATGCPAEVQTFAADVLKKVAWRPDELFMFDVCEVNGRLYLLELNSFSCSGWYAYDAASVVQAASRAALAH